MTLSVAIVEDNEQVRQGLATLLNGTPGFHCVGGWADAESALKELAAAKPMVVLMDVNLPGMDGVECVRQLRAAMPEIQVVMLTVHEDEDRIFEALKAGAHGYLTKQTPPAEILEAIAQVQAGGGPMSPNIARKVIQFFHPVLLPAEPPAAKPGELGLTPREREIMERLAEGFLYKEIAPALGISLETVRTHVRNTYEKLHVRTRTEALLKVYGRSKPRRTD